MPHALQRVAYGQHRAYKLQLTHRISIEQKRKVLQGCG
jgi:hypothetical protein